VSAFRGRRSHVAARPPVGARRPNRFPPARVSAVDRAGDALCADRRLLFTLRMLQVHDPVRDPLPGDGLDRCDERTDAGWAT
jgi:hypothetical protein